MLLTIVYGEQLTCIEISPDMELENFVGLCLIEIPALATVPSADIRLLFNGVVIGLSTTTMPKPMKEFGLSDGDAVSIERMSSPQSQQQGSVIQSQPIPNITSLVSNLIKGIKVPNGHSSVLRDKQKAKNIFDSLLNSAHLDGLRSDAPELAAAYESDPTNFEAFFQAYLKHKTDQIQKLRLMHDENSEEGQRFIAEQINRDNIDFTHQFAMEHMPEAFVPVHMLYIRMKINNHPVVAFIDSGAQVSILSESCAKRCNISRLVDTRFRLTAMGVGGTQKFVGRIHSCQVQVEGNIFPCSFDVMEDRNLDILFGLNLLRRHQCHIDLKKGVLRFADGSETPFISEGDFVRETAATKHKDSVPDVKDL